MMTQLHYCNVKRDLGDHMAECNKVQVRGSGGKAASIIHGGRREDPNLLQHHFAQL